MYKDLIQGQFYYCPFFYPSSKLATSSGTLKRALICVVARYLLLLKRVAIEKSIPFDLRIPNSETLNAIQELESGNGTKFNSYLTNSI
ncbi:MAG: type II toxin-antitoxin system RelB/DinJ family antitoxin [Desulfobacterales bacterium]|nr:type II toxin-antitoxin system RelB/DinJ family antitoxin [Desulfobacterales bacterium]